MEFPPCHPIACNLMHKSFYRFAVLIPLCRIVVRIERRGHSNRNCVSKNFSANVFRAPGVIVRGNNNYAFPMLRLQQFFQCFSFFAGIVGILWKSDDALFGNTAIEKVVRHQFRNPRIWPQPHSAGHHYRRQSLAKNFGRARGAISLKIIFAQNDDGVRFFQRIVDHQTFSRESQ